MNFFSKIFGNTAKINMEKGKNENYSSGGNWIGPDDTESGPSVSENWYIPYNTHA